jgi:hypothetical protein
MTRRPHQLTGVEAEDMFTTVTTLAERGGVLPLPIAL